MITAAVLLGAVMLSGCTTKKNMGNKNNNFDLPVNAQKFTQIYDDDIGEMTITVYDRTYTYFGDLKDQNADYSIRECLGYVDNSESTRLYTLADEPDDNYIMMKNLNSLTGYTVFYRANDTIHKDIFTPSYIKSLGFECWCDSGLHYEQPSATIGMILDVEDIKMVSYEYKINGEFAGGGETGVVSGRPYKKGELIYFHVTEYELGDHADKNKPFKISYTFTLFDKDDNSYEVKGTYDREMMLGAYLVGLEIRNDGNGYYIFEDV